MDEEINYDNLINFQLIPRFPNYKLSSEERTIVPAMVFVETKS